MYLDSRAPAPAPRGRGRPPRTRGGTAEEGDSAVSQVCNLVYRLSHNPCPIS